MAIFAIRNHAVAGFTPANIPANLVTGVGIVAITAFVMNILSKLPVVKGESEFDRDSSSFGGFATEREAREADMQAHIDRAYQAAQDSIRNTFCKDPVGSAAHLLESMYEAGLVGRDYFQERIERNPDLARELEFVRDASED